MKTRDDVLREWWNRYAEAGYERVYNTRSTIDLQKKLRELFLDTGGGTVLDAGCGTGGMFEAETQRLCPKEILAADWSKEMLRKARTLADKTTTTPFSDGVVFELENVDLTQVLPWPDETFDAGVSNLVICYLSGGWQIPVRELHRVIKQGGCLYLSTFLKEWDFSTAVRKFALREFLHSPIATLYGVRFKNIAAQISKEAKKRGAEYPSQDELIGFLKNLGFREIKTLPIYWGFGLVLRAQKA